MSDADEQKRVGVLFRSEPNVSANREGKCATAQHQDRTEATSQSASVCARHTLTMNKHSGEAEYQETVRSKPASYDGHARCMPSSTLFCWFRLYGPPRSCKLCHQLFSSKPQSPSEPLPIINSVHSRASTSLDICPQLPCCLHSFCLAIAWNASKHETA